MSEPNNLMFRSTGWWHTWLANPNLLPYSQATWSVLYLAQVRRQLEVSSRQSDISSLSCFEPQLALYRYFLAGANLR